MMADMTIARAPEDFVELCTTLYGSAVDADEVWIGVHKASPDQADVNTKSGKLKPTGHKRTAAENIALATNTLGVVAAPAAITGAYKLSRQGQRGLPYKGALKAAEARERRINRPSRAAGYLRRVGSRTGRAGKIGAGVLGAGAVGLQVGNASGDAISAAHFAKPQAKRTEEAKVGKAAPSLGADVKRMASNVVRMWTPQKPAAVAPAPPKPGTRAYVKDARATKDAKAKRAATTQKDIKRGGDFMTAMNTGTGKVMAGTIGLGTLSAVNRSRQPSPYEYAYGKREADVEIRGEFTKFDDAKRQAFGWASITKVDGVPVVDRQEDYIDIDDLETAAYNYVHKSRVGGDMHRRNGDVPHKVSDMIESMVFTPEKIEKMGLPENFPQGWWVGYQIHDEDTWQEVRKRGRTGFSIHGKGLRKDHDLDELMGS